MATPAAADEVLFFVPDLGGFTKFIAETEIQHSQHIIKELLEILVDANTLGMKVRVRGRRRILMGSVPEVSPQSCSAG
jgi:hypothetical protein